VTNEDFQLPVTLGGVETGKTNSLKPTKGIICISTDNDEEPYLVNTLLVKLVENKKLRKLYQIQKGD
jgi:mannitol/fructose-specific phosphotransferase system IIA component